MTQIFRLMSKEQSIRHNDIVLFVTRLDGEIRACLLLPPHTGEVRVSEFHTLDEAVALAREAAGRHNLELAVLFDDDSGLHWRKEWPGLFGTVH